MRRRSGAPGGSAWESIVITGSLGRCLFYQLFASVKNSFVSCTYVGQYKEGDIFYYRSFVTI